MKQRPGTASSSVSFLHRFELLRFFFSAGLRGLHCQAEEAEAMGGAKATSAAEAAGGAEAKKPRRGGELHRVLQHVKGSNFV